MNFLFVNLELVNRLYLLAKIDGNNFYGKIKNPLEVMILLNHTVDRLNSKEIRLSFPKSIVEQLHLKIHPVNTPKSIHILINDKEVGFVTCIFDQTKIFKKKIKLQIETDNIVLNCEAYNDYVEFLDIQVFTLQMFMELPSMIEDYKETQLPTILESCTLAIPREILINVATLEFTKRFEALNEICDIIEETSNNSDILKCIGSLLNFLLADNRPKIVILRIKLASSISDVVHLERILENAYDYQSYIQNHLINALVATKIPLQMLLKTKPKLIPICLQVLEQSTYKPTLSLLEFLLYAASSPNRDLALKLWYHSHKQFDDKTVVELVEKLIPNNKLKVILLSNIDINQFEVNGSFVRTKSSKSLNKSRPSTANSNLDIQASKQKLMEPIDSKCVFCLENCENMLSMDNHYYKCPMLMLCQICDEIVEVAEYYSHSNRPFHEQYDKNQCPFCCAMIPDPNGWKQHLMGPHYNPVDAQGTKIPIRTRQCSGDRTQIPL